MRDEGREIQRRAGRRREEGGRKGGRVKKDGRVRNREREGEGMRVGKKGQGRREWLKEVRQERGRERK